MPGDPMMDVATARVVFEAKMLEPAAPRRNLWWAVIKPPMYAVAYVPIMVRQRLHVPACVRARACVRVCVHQ